MENRVIFGIHAKVQGGIRRSSGVEFERCSRWRFSWVEAGEGVTQLFEVLFVSVMVFVSENKLSVRLVSSFVFGFPSILADVENGLFWLWAGDGEGDGDDLFCPSTLRSGHVCWLVCCQKTIRRKRVTV
ncbi:hypothetical protein I3760_02G113300 [Carya illinoinensis]|nr:hypothetical protein I3760_02G113300 [Carya illinoinensis]